MNSEKFAVIGHILINIAIYVHFGSIIGWFIYRFSDGGPYEKTIASIAIPILSFLLVLTSYCMWTITIEGIRAGRKQPA